MATDAASRAVRRVRRVRHTLLLVAVVGLLSAVAGPRLPTSPGSNPSQELRASDDNTVLLPSGPDGTVQGEHAQPPERQAPDPQPPDQPAPHRTTSPTCPLDDDQPPACVGWRTSLGPPGLIAASRARGRVLVASRTGEVQAVDAATGATLWQTSLDEADEAQRLGPRLLTPIAGVLPVALAGDLMLLDLVDGRTRAVLAGLDPVAIGGDAARLLAVTEGRIVTFSPSGTPGWDRDLAPGERAMLDGSTAYVSAEDGRLTQLFTTSGSARWEHALPGPVAALAVSAGDTIVALETGHLRSIDRLGTLRWEQHGIGALHTLRADDHTVVVVGASAEGPRVLVIDAATGEIRAETAIDTSEPADGDRGAFNGEHTGPAGDRGIGGPAVLIDDDLIAVTTHRPRPVVLLLDAATGALRARVALDETPVELIAATHDALAVITADLARPWTAAPRTLMVLDRTSGELRWRAALGIRGQLLGGDPPVLADGEHLTGLRTAMQPEPAPGTATRPSQGRGTCS